MAATPADGGGDDEFIWRELIKRQQRWYEHVAAGHKAAGQLRRDAQNRFIATPRCPLPFSPVDKLAERRWCEARDVAQPRLLFTLTAPSELLAIAPQLPRSWVVKPVGAGHSDGVIVVEDGRCVNRGGVALNLADVVAELEALVRENTRRNATTERAETTARPLEGNEHETFVPDEALVQRANASSFEKNVSDGRPGKPACFETEKIETRAAEDVGEKTSSGVEGVMSG